MHCLITNMAVYERLEFLVGDDNAHKRICSEIALELQSAGNIKRCSDTLQQHVYDAVDGASWCYKAKRDGTPSRCLKAGHTLIRLAVSKEMKSLFRTEGVLAVLLKYASVLEKVRRAFFTISSRLELDFVDKFYKFEVQHVLLQTDEARAECGAVTLDKYMDWVRATIKSMRSVFNVSLQRRIEQQDKTNRNRTEGLQMPVCITDGDVLVLTSALWQMVREAENEQQQIAALLCLLQLSCGGRARDVILVNRVESVDDENIRVHNLTKKKITDWSASITKPILTQVIGNSVCFVQLLSLARNFVVDHETKKGTLKREWLTNDEQCLDYSKQWYKSKEIEQIVDGWTARMRRALNLCVDQTENKTLRLMFSKKRATHQLRKLYVACSMQQSKTTMKEPAWAQIVLGHSHYNTSLLYMNTRLQ